MGSVSSGTAQDQDEWVGLVGAGLASTEGQERVGESPEPHLCHQHCDRQFVGFTLGTAGAGAPGAWAPLWWWPYVHPINRLGQCWPGADCGQRTEASFQTTSLLLMCWGPCTTSGFVICTRTLQAAGSRGMPHMQEGRGTQR